MKKRRKLLCNLLLVTMCAGCSSASHDVDTTEKKQEEVNVSVNESEDYSNENTEYEGISILSYSDYSDGYAWIQYNDSEGMRKISLIDKNGMIQPIKDGNAILDGIQIYSSSDSNAIFKPFYENYAVVNDGNGTWYWINKDMEVQKKIDSTSENEIMAAGGEYYLLKKDSSDYESAKKNLCIMNLKDEILTDIDLLKEQIEKPDQGVYYGHGIFSVAYAEDTSTYSTVTLRKVLLSISKVTKLDFDDLIFSDQRFSADGKYLVTGYRQNTNENNTEISYIDKDGNFDRCMIDGLWATSEKTNKDGWVLLCRNQFHGDNSNNGPYQSLKIGAGGIIESHFSGTNHAFNVDKILLDSFSDNNRIALTSIGADNKFYTLILNEKLELIGEPKLGKKEGNCSDGRIIVNDQEKKCVYDTENGNEVFSTTEFAEIKTFSDNVAAATRIKDFKNAGDSRYVADPDAYTLGLNEVIYLDEKGNRLFESLR